MTHVARPGALAESARPARAAVVAFATTVAVSAALLFAVQPMLGKALLPAFGGGAAVWTAVMLFFQVGLLAGSLLFHLTTTRLGPPVAAAIHVALAAIGAALLPLTPTPRETGLGPTFDVLATLAAGYGPAVLALGGNAAALQAWYARAVGQPPWWLYAVSNGGSLFGLAAYPLLLEPNLALSAQGRLWLWGFAACGLGLALCAWLAQRGANTVPSPAVGAMPQAAAAAPDWRRRVTWVLLAALPSSLLLGVTEHVTVSIAPLPLLWVLPLAAYLLSWIIAFWRPEAAARWGLVAVVILLLPLVAEAIGPVISARHQTLGVAIHVGGLLAAGVLAHGRLALLRPEPSQLTGFYLLISLGGALGGLANAVVAPAVLDRTLEYPFALALLCLLPAMGRPRQSWVVWGAVAALMAAAPFLGAWRGKPALAYARDFYGTVKVQQEADRLLMAHGRTLHGYQWRDPARRLEPSSYYHREAGAGRLIAAMQALRGAGAPPMEAAMVGLGPGTMACYGSDSLRLSFIEISPAVIATARDWFTFLRECGEPPVELGDGRIRLQARAPASLDLIVIDAYSGASIPVHMATAEATAMYLERLRPDGALVVHVSNGNFDLPPLVAAAAREVGATALMFSANPAGTPSVWVAVTRDAGLVERLAAEGWTAPEPAPRPWRDDRWDLLSALNWRGLR
ncbi:fused MFS/spermidine synthase [Falsiroseomonas oryzae]|uniref:fused MFS/spermidine synthase n=1 Tax=Falsiroseomonas oryzae TaxID=2766473 RepID=UPI0022EB35A5|nr:fused MFS/spermidine synthase [Roseomonas sp. MO-31]